MADGATPATRNGPRPAPPELMQAFQDGLPVRLIMTPREKLDTCRADEPIADVVARNPDDFDYFPVACASLGEARIIGLLKVEGLSPANAPRDTARTQCIPLSDDTLIGADASILDFMRDADEKPCRLVVAGRGIAGLVSWSDMQKLPVRAALFALITQLEMAMADAIERMCPTPEHWKRLLHPEQRKALAREIKKAEHQNRWISDLLCTSLSMKVTIITGLDDAGEDRSQFEDHMNKITRLRNDLAHAKDHVGNRSTARELCGTVRFIEMQIACLRALSQASSERKDPL